MQCVNLKGDWGQLRLYEGEGIEDFGHDQGLPQTLWGGRMLKVHSRGGMAYRLRLYIGGAMKDIGHDQSLPQTLWGMMMLQVHSREVGGGGGGGGGGG